MNLEAFERHLIWAEGYRKKPYRCTAGKLSIGVGRNLEDRGLSDDEMLYLMRNDMNEAVRAAATLGYWSELNEARQLVVADMVFNLGLAGWLEFRRANAALAAGDYARAAEEMQDSRWYEQVGRRAKRLVEAMRTGEWTW